jgi:PAS domain S-box-containing protein
MSQPQESVSTDAGTSKLRLNALSPLHRYGVALLSAIVASLLRIALNGIWGKRFPFLLFVPVVLLSTWFGGIGPGLVATLVSVLVVLFFVFPTHYFLVVTDGDDIRNLIGFLFLSALLILITEGQRRVMRRAEQNAEEARRAHEALRESEEWLSITLRSVGDGVIATDAQGRITFMNPVAETLTGWFEADAKGRPAPEVFRILNEDTRTEVESPVERVIREGAIVGLANHTILVAKDGVERPIDDSGAPIQDDRGGLRGVVLVFRDVTERRNAEAMQAEFAAKQTHIAETLQRALLIAPAEYDFPALAINTCYEPAWDEAYIGGDFFDAFAVDERHVALVTGDVTGKGLASAVFTSEVKFALRAFLRENISPAAALKRLNHFLLSTQRFGPQEQSALVAVALAVVDTVTGEIRAAGGGNEPPLLIRADGDAEEIPAGGFVLGAIPDWEYQEISARLDPHDTLVLVTDGITEARCGTSFFGYKGFMETAQRAATNASGSLGEVGRSIIGEARDFAGGRLQDDACLLLVRLRS